MFHYGTILAHLMLNWQEIVTLHNDSIEQFNQAAMGIPADEWSNSENGKWTPADVTAHLTLVYEVLLTELDGGKGMQLRTNFWVRQLLRWFLVPRLLRGGPFPKGSPAPRETRPAPLRAVDQAEAIKAFNELARRFAETIQSSYEQNPKTQLTHAYFGSSTLNDSLLLCTRHIQHHTKQIGMRAP